MVEHTYNMMTLVAESAGKGDSEAQPFFEKTHLPGGLLGRMTCDLVF